MKHPRLWKVLGWSGAAFGVLLLIVFALVGWLLFTTAGARWVADTATQRFAPQVAYEAIEGTIAGELGVRGLRFEAGPDTAKIRIAHLTVDPTLRMLFSRTLRVERATVTGLVLTLPEQPKPDEPDQPMWVEPPLDVVVREFALLDGRVFDAGKPLASVKQLDVSARWTREELVIEKLALLPGDIHGRVSVTGRITPAEKLVRAVLDARWSDVVIPAALAGRELHSAGRLDIDGTPERYAARGEFQLGPPGELARVVLALDGTPEAAMLERFDVTQAAGKLALRGKVGFVDPMTWDLSAQTDDFNPGAFLAQWPGSIDLDVATQGELAEAGPRGNLQIRALQGQLRGRPLAGGGQLDFAAPSRFAGDLALSSGQSRVNITGRSGAGRDIDATVDLHIASLNDWAPGTKGRLDGRFQVGGVWPRLDIAGGAHGHGLGVGRDEDGSYAATVKQLRVRANVSSPLDPSGDLQITAETVDLAGQAFARVRVTGEGSQAKHRVGLEAEGDALRTSVSLAGGVTKTGWSGEISALELSLPDIADLSLQAPARVVYDAGTFSLSRACLRDADSSLCAAVTTQASGALDASYSFAKVPLALANAIAPEAMPGQLRGEVQGQGKVRRAADGQWFGDAAIASAGARLVLLDEEPGATALGQQTFTLYENLKLQARLEGSRATARLDASLDHGGRLEGSMAIGQLTSAAPTLDGTVSASMPTLAPFAAFVPTVANLDGSVDARVRIGGTTAAPEFTGNLDAKRLQADLGELGIELRDGEVRGEAARGGGFTLAGRVHSGKGHVAFKGDMSARGVVDLRIDGENFLAADIPAANVVVTPDLALTGEPKAYLLKGTVTIPRADINLQKLPQDEPPGASPDVVVVRDGEVVQSATQKSDLPLTAQVLVKMGENIVITGYGLDASVRGELTVREAPGEPTTGSGQLTVGGTYKAYGQDLSIEEGRLLFAGTPLDNPRLSIVAMREIDDELSTGLRIAGSAKRPVITVVSDPNVGEADALSYLVTGRSLSDVGSASGSSQDALASATRSLESSAGGLIAKRIGQRLGLDEAGVEENEMIGGSALTIGEYLSPRLYLSYGVGLFEPGEVIALRYKLSEDIGVNVQRGSEETRAGVEYRIER
jgi:translocation and assembly module TamB